MVCKIAIGSWMRRLVHKKASRRRQGLSRWSPQWPAALRFEPLEERALLSIQPDLIVADALVGPATTVVGNNDSVAVTWTVKNQGTWAPTQNWRDAFYLSNRNVLDNTAVFVGSVARYDAFPLAIGGTYTSSTTLTIPSISLQGNQNLLVVTDPGNTINESDANNNTFSVPIGLSAPNVNLAISNASATPASVTAGNGAVISVSWTVTNNGTDPAQTSWYDRPLPFGQHNAGLHGTVCPIVHGADDFVPRRQLHTDRKRGGAKHGAVGPAEPVDRGRQQQHPIGDQPWR